MPQRLGLLGGTFDPIHYGHLMIAEIIGEELSLDRVLFLPAGIPPHKPGQPISSATHRLRMTELAVEDNPRFAVSTMDIETDRRSFTVDLLRRIARLEPGADLFFIMGADSLRDFPTWHDPVGIVRQARLAVANRPGFPLDLEDIYALVPEARARTVVVSSPAIDVSATAIRARAASERSIRYLTPEPVRAYIMTHRIYSEPGR